jgi:hypothetical protein
LRFSAHSCCYYAPFFPHPVHVSKLLCGTHIKSNYKWILKYADSDIWKRMSNCCLSVKHRQSGNHLLTSKK